MVFLVCCLVALLVVVLVLAPIVRETTVESAAVEIQPEVSESRGRIYDAILELDFDYQCGKLTQEDYRELRERYVIQAGALLGIEGELPSEPERELVLEETPDERPSLPAPHCASCGVALPVEARYCFLCGLSVPA